MTVGDNLAAACAEVARLDVNGLQHGRDYTVNLQATRNQSDRSGQPLGPLISYVDPQVFNRPTFRLFLRLLDNYNRVTGTAETFGPHELREQSDFLDACMQTQCMQYAHRWLSGRGLIGADPAQFKAALTQMWFSLYRREVQNDSSGFEHVFLGESDNGEVKGLHSWIQVHLEERKGTFQYRGYLQPFRAGGGKGQASEQDRVLSIHFAWMGQTKAISSIIMGSSPEFELALYTLCFLGGAEENIVWLDTFQLKIKAYRIRSKYGDKIGTAFPELMTKSEGGQPPLPQQHVQPHQEGYQYPPQQQHHQQQQQHHHQAAWGGAGQPHTQQQQAQGAWNQGPLPQQQQHQQQTNQTDNTTQGCFNLIGALLNIFCASNKNSNRN